MMKTFEIDGRKLFYTDQGQGRPVLILHGACLFVEGSWDPVVRCLVENGCRVIYPLRAGRGQSDPHPVFLSLARDRRDAWALLDHLGVRRCVLVGHSQGACVACDMLLSAPERVEGIVIEDSASFGKFTTDDYLNAGVERFDPQTRRLYEKWLPTLEYLGRPWEYPSDYNVMRLLKARRFHSQEEEWKYQQVPDPDDAPVPQGAFCKSPALVFAAGRGRIRQNDPETEELRARLPAEDVRLVVATHSGHAIHEEQLDLFAQSLLSFLATLPA